MSTSQWPSDLAWELLKEFESDPLGLGFLDVDRLLDEWEVTETLPGEDLSAYRARAHRNLPEFFVYYPMHHELGDKVILGLCSWLRTLHRRLSA